MAWMVLYLGIEGEGKGQGEREAPPGVKGAVEDAMPNAP